MTTENTPTTPTDSEALGDLFRRASRMMARTYHRRAHAHHAQGHVFSIIKERGSIQQRELLELLDVRSSSLSEVLGKLERNGLIVRKRNEEDKRSFVVSVNQNADAGAFSQQEDGSRQSADALFASLNEDEKQQLATLLNKVINSIEDDPLCQKSLHDRFRHGRRHHKHQGKHDCKHGRHGRGKRGHHKDGDHKSFDNGI